MKDGWQHKDEKFGIHSFFGYSLAEMRDRIIGKELKHLWVKHTLGLCPLCCEQANMTSDEEALKLELKEPEFRELKSLTKKIKDYLQEETIYF